MPRGIQTGGLVHVLAATIGVSALLASSAVAFSVVKYAGAAYLIHLGLRKLLAMASDSTYALVAGSVRGWLGERRKALARISGCSYVGSGVLAALSPGSSSRADELMQ
jgi:threonine/homoserine/homoserine lactone efflux protein